MTAVTENDLKRLEDLIVSGQKAIESRLTTLENGQKAIKKDLGEIKGDIKALDAKVTGLEKRFDDPNGRVNITTIGFLSIVGILVTGMLTIVGKTVFFPSP
jgi:peptidoglycan hydrolase CwlO-like protein